MFMFKNHKTAQLRGFNLKFLVKLFSKSLRGLGQRPKVLVLTLLPVLTLTYPTTLRKLVAT